jgi:hypothetical protein
MSTGRFQLAKTRVVEAAAGIGASLFLVTITVFTGIGVIVGLAGVPAGAVLGAALSGWW